MNDAEARELIKRMVTLDYRLTVLIEILSQLLGKSRADQFLKDMLHDRTEGFVGPKCNAVADQVLAEIRESAARYSEGTSDSE